METETFNAEFFSSPFFFCLLLVLSCHTDTEIFLYVTKILTLKFNFHYFFFLFCISPAGLVKNLISALIILAKCFHFLGFCFLYISLTFKKDIKPSVELCTFQLKRIQLNKMFFSVLSILVRQWNRLIEMNHDGENTKIFDAV